MKKSDALKIIGPTGDYPEGKLSPDDKGGLMVAIGIDGDKIRFEFGAPVTWLLLGKSNALALAALLMHQAELLPDEKSH